VSAESRSRPRGLSVWTRQSLDIKYGDNGAEVHLKSMSLKSSRVSNAVFDALRWTLHSDSFANHRTYDTTILYSTPRRLKIRLFPRLRPSKPKHCERGDEDEDALEQQSLGTPRQCTHRVGERWVRTVLILKGGSASADARNAFIPTTVTTLNPVPLTSVHASRRIRTGTYRFRGDRGSNSSSEDWRL
jgi:hypothetical protein